MANSFFNTQYILGRNRYPWIDYARGICIILVCYRHTYEGLVNAGILQTEAHPILKYFNVFFFSFRMPLFFIISGLFIGLSLAKKGMGQFVEGRLRYVFYPMVIWGVIQITLQLFLADYANAHREPIDYLYLLIAPREIEQFWYLNALFFVSVIYAVLKYKLKFSPRQQLGLGVILYLVASVLIYRNINVGFLIDVFFFYPFFALGDCIAGIINDPQKRAKLLSTRMLLYLLPLFLLGQYAFTTINIAEGDDYFVQHKVTALYALIAIVGCLFVINVSYGLEKLNVAKFLRVVGYHSLYIYVMHLIVIAAVRALYNQVLGLTDVYIFMIVGISLGILIPMITYNLANSINAGWLFELKKKEDKIQEVKSDSFVPKPNKAKAMIL